jgi:hypothetical protein
MEGMVCVCWCLIGVIIGIVWMEFVRGGKPL